MGVLNWMQNRLHGSYHRNRKSEFSASSNDHDDQLTTADTSGGISWNDTLDNDWSTAMVSIGTCGMKDKLRLKNWNGSGRSHTDGGDELKRLREQITLLMGAKGVATVEELNGLHHLPLERLLNCTWSSKNGWTIKPRSVRKLVPSALGGFLHRPSFRETEPEWRPTATLQASLHKDKHCEYSTFSDPLIRDLQAVQMIRKGKSEAEEEGVRWIKTDSEYIVLEI
ncbi:hypothetical protein ACP4OV_015252 [Aristida adscensionis]